MIKGGPKIVTDGLQLCLDAHDAKSYAGEPTQNYFINTGSSGGWWGDGSNQTIGSKGVIAVTDENLKYNGYPTVLWIPGTSKNAYLNGGTDIDTSATSTEWTFSVYAKYEDGSTFSSMDVYLYYPSSDGSAAGTITDVGNGWKRISRTRTGSSNYINLAGITGISSNKKIYLSGWQLEKKQYITPVVGINSSRSATNGWVDRSGNSNNGTLVNGVNTGVSHYRDGEVIMPGANSYLDFDGSDDYIDGPIVAPNIGAFTYEAVIYRTSSDFLAVGSGTALGGGTYMQIYVYDAGMRVNLYAPQGLGGGWKTGNTIPNISNTFVENNTYHVTVVNDGTVFYFYKNGVSLGSYDHSYLGNTSSTRLGILRNHVQSVGGTGRVYLARMYDKALTAAEVLSNYNATKGRFS